MFGMGMPEILLILAIALIVIGPKKLPDLAKGLGRALGEFKRATGELKASIDIEPGLKDVKNTFDEMNTDLKEVINSDPVSPGEGAKKPDPAESDEDKASDEPVIAENLEATGKGFDNLKQAFDELNAEQPETDLEATPPESEKDPDTDVGKVGKQASAAEKENPESTSHGR